MENVESKPKKKFDLSSYAVVVGFLALEIMAFISFYLGHSFILYGSLSIALAILLGLVTFRQINKDGVASFAFFLFPIFVFGLLTALSAFGFNSVGSIGMAETVFVPIALTCISISGFLTGYIKGFKIKMAMIIIYGALALFVFINSLITMVYYVPFYTLIYAHSYIFYGGKPSVLPIGSMAYMLFGFRIIEVTLEYWSLFPALLLTSVIPLFFINRKESKREFILYIVFASIAFLSLLFTISKYTLITDLILVMGIAMIVVAGKFIKSRQALNIAMVVVGVLALLFVTILFVISQTSWGFVSGLRNVLTTNRLFARFFANGYSQKAMVIFQDLINPSYNFFKLFGVPVGGASYLYPNNVQQDVSNIWLFDNILSSGLFGAIFFIVALVIGIRRLFKYIKYVEEEDSVKYSITGYILGFLIMSLVLYDVTPLVNSDAMSPFFTSAPLLIAIFLLAYVFNKTTAVNIKPVPQKEEEKEPENVEAENDEVISL